MQPRDTLRPVIDLVRQIEKAGLNDRLACDIREKAVSARAAILEVHRTAWPDARAKGVGPEVFELMHMAEDEFNDALALCTAIATIVEGWRQHITPERGDMVEAIEWLAYRAGQRWGA
jgi:hypothetical protein